MSTKRFFVTGIGTEIGKTVVSAILVEALKADYWKPVQSGDLHHSDTMKVKDLVSNSTSVFHEESYRLTEPMSPHASAEREGIQISLDQINPPATNNHLIVEGAGGLMVPLNDKDLILDLIKKLELKVVLVSRNYLGSINHTLLTYEVLKQHKIEIEGVVFNGKPNLDSECFILKYTGLPCLLKVLEEEKLSKEMVRRYAREYNI